MFSSLRTLAPATAALLLSLLTGCGAINDSNKHLESMDNHMGQVDSRMGDITSAVNNLTAQLAQMQTLIREMMVTALRVMFPPPGTTGNEDDLPSADEMGGGTRSTSTPATTDTSTGVSP